MDIIKFCDWLMSIDWLNTTTSERLKAFAIVLTLLGSVSFTVKFAAQCINLRAFRGPLALPLIGNCYLKEALFLMRYLSQLRKKYGKHFTFFAFTKPYIVVCDPISVRRILSDSKVFIKGTDYTETFAVAFGKGLVTSNGEQHRKDRSKFNKLFVKTSVAKHMKMINRVTTELIDEMLQPDGELAKSTKGETNANGVVFNIEHYFAVLSLRVFCNFALGQGLGREKEEWLAGVVSHGSFAVGRMITLGLPMWDIFPATGTIKSSRKSLWELLKVLVDERKKNPLPEGEDGDCLSVMIEENMTDQEMNDHLVTLLSAGHDTTAYFSAYCMYLLSTHQEVQDKLRGEIAARMKGRSEVTADDVTEMKYLNCVMQETLRLYAIISNVSRHCTTTTHIKENGVTFPAGCDVLIPMFLINRDPELWEEPSKFRPERFEGSTGFFTNAKNGYFPFGYGSRTCIGNTLSQMESAVFICHLLMKYEVNEDVGFKPTIFSGISLTTSNGINVRLKEKQTTAGILSFLTK